MCPIDQQNPKFRFETFPRVSFLTSCQKMRKLKKKRREGKGKVTAPKASKIMALPRLAGGPEGPVCPDGPDVPEGPGGSDGPGGPSGSGGPSDPDGPEGPSGPRVVAQMALVAVRVLVALMARTALVALRS